MGRKVVGGLYLSGIGWYFAASIGIGLLIGYWADGATGLKPTFTLVGLGIGLAVGIYGAIRMLLTYLDRFGGTGKEPE